MAEKEKHEIKRVQGRHTCEFCEQVDCYLYWLESIGLHVCNKCLDAIGTKQLYKEQTMDIKIRIEWALWSLMVAMDFTDWTFGISVGPMHIEIDCS